MFDIKICWATPALLIYYMLTEFSLIIVICYKNKYLISNFALSSFSATLLLLHAWTYRIISFLYIFIEEVCFCGKLCRDNFTYIWPKEYRFFVVNELVCFYLNATKLLQVYLRLVVIGALNDLFWKKTYLYSLLAHISITKGNTTQTSLTMLDHVY